MPLWFCLEGCIYLFISQVINPDMNKRREKLSFWRSHCSSPTAPSTSALERKEPLYRSNVWGHTLVGQGRDPGKGEWQIVSYMDGKGHCNKSNLGNWEWVKRCYRLEEDTKSKQMEQRQNFLHMWMWQNCGIILGADKMEQDSLHALMWNDLKNKHLLRPVINFYKHSKSSTCCATTCQKHKLHMFVT